MKFIIALCQLQLTGNNVCIISSTLRIQWIMIIIKNFNFFIMYVFYRFQLGRETYCGCWLYCHPLDWPSSSEIVLPWWQHLQVRCFEYCLPWKVIWRLIIKNTFTVIRNTQLIGEKFHQHTVKGNILCIDVLNNLKVAHYTVFREMFAPNFFLAYFTLLVIGQILWVGKFKTSL